MKQRLLALLLALTLLALSACAPAGKDSTQQETQPEQSAQDTAPTQEPTESAAPAEEPTESDALTEEPTEAAAPAEEATESAEDSEAGFQLQEGEWMTPGEGADADGRGPDEEDDPYGAEIEPSEGAPIDPDAIKEAEFEQFTATVPDAQQKARGFRDFAETMKSDFTGTWYDPKAGEAFRITDKGAYVYIPYLDLWGDQPCDWELIDRSEQGKCPKLVIYCFGTCDYGLAYYVAGNTGAYFWCVSQGQLFYKQ